MPLLEELEVPAAEEDIPGREDGPPTDDDDTTGALLEFPAWDEAPRDDAGALLLPFREEEELAREEAVVLLAPVEEEPAVLEEPAALDAPPPDDEELASCGSPVEPHPTANAATSPGKPTRIRMDNLPGSGMWGMGGTPSIAQGIQRVCCQPGLRDAQRTHSDAAGGDGSAAGAPGLCGATTGALPWLHTGHPRSRVEVRCRPPAPRADSPTDLHGPAAL